MLSTLCVAICRRWTIVLSVGGLFAQGIADYYSRTVGDSVILSVISLTGCSLIFALALFDLGKAYIRARELGAEWTACSIPPFIWPNIRNGVHFFPPQIIMGVASSFVAFCLSVASLSDMMDGFKNTYYNPFSLICGSLTLISAFSDYEAVEKELLFGALKKNIADVDYACYEVSGVKADIEDLVECSKLFLM